MANPALAQNDRLTRRPDDVPGRIVDSTVPTLRLSWTFALLWNLISAPTIAYGLPQALREGNWLVLVALVFPAAGAGLLIWAVRSTLRWRKFGTSVLEMAVVPASLGSEFEGTLRAHLDRPPDDGIGVTLSCVHHYVTGSGRSRSTWEKILWQEQQQVPADRLATEPGGCRVPVAFAIPYDAPETRGGNSDDRILWRLEARAAVPGVDYRAMFEVPVSDPKEATVGPAGNWAGAIDPARTPFGPDVTGPGDRPRRPRIHVGPSPDGGTEFRFPAARNPVAAVVVTAYLILFSGAFWMIGTASRAIAGPLGVIVLGIFCAAFGLVCLMLLAVVLVLWLRTTTVIVGPEGVTVTESLCGLHRSRTIPRSEVAAFRTKIGMQSGRIVYYDIRILKVAGGELAAGSDIRDKHEAESLAAAMTCALS